MSEQTTPPPPPVPEPTPRTAPVAIWSLVLAVLSFTCGWLFTAIPAVICGHVARSKIRKSEGALGGTRIATAGLILGYIALVLGVMGMLLALLFVVIFGGAATLVGTSGDADAAIAVPVIGILGSLLALFSLMLAIPELIIGYGLWRCRPWARIAGIVLSVLSLLWVPFGTIVGLYGLWVLFNKESERLFDIPGAPVCLWPSAAMRSTSANRP